MPSNVVPLSVREKLGPEATSGLVDLFNQAGTTWKADVITVVSDRFERRLVEETSKLRVEMAHGFAAIRQEMRDEFGAVRREMAQQGADLRQAMATDRFELLKWAFIFWMGQFFASASLMLVLIRFLKPGG